MTATVDEPTAAVETGRRRHHHPLRWALLAMVVVVVAVGVGTWVAVDDTHLASTMFSLEGATGGADPQVVLTGSGGPPVLSAPPGHPVYVFLGLATSGPLGLSLRQIDLSSADGSGFTVPLAAVRSLPSSLAGGVPGPSAWNQSRPWNGSIPGSSRVQLVLQLVAPTCGGTTPHGVAVTGASVRAGVSVLERTYGLTGTPTFTLQAAACG